MSIIARLRRIGLAAALACSTSLPAGAADLTVKPSHVHQLWGNVNACLLASLRASAKTRLLGPDLRDMQAESFDGKTPGDVLERARVIHEKVQTLRTRLKMEPWPGDVEVAAGAAVKPADVFRQTGLSLDALASMLVAVSGPEQFVSACYDADYVDGMSPSDVYSVADLAERRLDIVLQAFGS